MILSSGAARRMAATLLVLVTALAAGVAGSREADAQDAPLPAVVVAPAEMTDLRPSATYNGRLRAIQKVEIRPRVSGFLEAIGFEEGAHVAAGDVLYEIEDGAYAAAVAEIEAAIAAAEADLRLAEIEVDRQRQLVERNAVAQSQLDVAEADLGKARGEVERLRARLERARLDLSYTRITAPFGGVTGLTAVDVGAFVEPATGALTTLTRLDPITVEFPVTTRELLRYRRSVEAGEASGEAIVELELPDGSAYPSRGTIDFIDAEVAAGTDTVTVRAVFDNPDGLLLDGALVGVRLEEDRPEPVLTVPQRAVQRDQVGPFVMVVDDAGVVDLRRVEVARSEGGLSVIREGLEPGETVVTDGINKVRPGIAVDAAVAGGNAGR